MRERMTAVARLDGKGRRLLKFRIANHFMEPETEADAHQLSATRLHTRWIAQTMKISQHRKDA